MGIHRPPTRCSYSHQGVRGGCSDYRHPRSTHRPPPQKKHAVSPHTRQSDSNDRKPPSTQPNLPIRKIFLKRPDITQVSPVGKTSVAWRAECNFLPGLSADQGGISVRREWRSLRRTSLRFAKRAESFLIEDSSKPQSPRNRQKDDISAEPPCPPNVFEKSAQEVTKWVVSPPDSMGVPFFFTFVGGLPEQIPLLPSWQTNR